MFSDTYDLDFSKSDSVAHLIINDVIEVTVSPEEWDVISNGIGHYEYWGASYFDKGYSYGDVLKFQIIDIKYPGPEDEYEGILPPEEEVLKFINENINGNICIIEEDENDEYSADAS